MAIAERPLLEVGEVLEEYRDVLPPGLSTSAGLYRATRMKVIPSIEYGRRVYIIRRGLEQFLNGELMPPQA